MQPGIVPAHAAAIAQARQTDDLRAVATATMGLTIPDLVGFAAVDACRTMATLAHAPPDLFFRAAQLIHVLFTRPAMREQLRAADATGDDMLCCAGAALFATAKCVSFLNLMILKNVATLVHRLQVRRGTLPPNSRFGQLQQQQQQQHMMIPAPTEMERQPLVQRIVRWEWVLLEASAFRVVAPTPFPFAVHLAGLIYDVCAARAIASDASKPPTGDKRKSAKGIAALETVAQQLPQSVNQLVNNFSPLSLSREEFTLEVIARCSDAARSAALATRIPAHVVAAAAVQATVSNKPEFTQLLEQVFPKSSSSTAAATATSSTSRYAQYQWARCMGSSCTDATINEALEELQRVYRQNRPTSFLARNWAAIVELHQQLQREEQERERQKPRIVPVTTQPQQQQQQPQPTRPAAAAAVAKPQLPITLPDITLNDLRQQQQHQQQQGNNNKKDNKNKNHHHGNKSGSSNNNNNKNNNNKRHHDDSRRRDRFGGGGVRDPF